jgi:two-component system chemotaxis response regulator CheY
MTTGTASPRERLRRASCTGRSLRILVVEDHEDQMALITHVLTAAGFQVVQADGGENAVEKLRTQQIDLVLTDLAMPNVSGVQVIAAAKADHEIRAIPVVVVSGYTWDEIGRAALVAGADGYVNKPFTPERLIREVKKQLRTAPLRVMTALPGLVQKERSALTLDLLR